MSREPSFLKNRSLKELSTIGIGGHAENYIEVRRIEELQEAIKICLQNNLRYFILGKGSNTLFDDRGYQGVIIHNKIDFCEEKSSGIFFVGAGYSFSLLGAQTARKGWSGLEFASGIPGSVGGAIFMNAGANGAETCNTLKNLTFITDEGEIKHFEKKELSFSYRYSTFHKLKGAIAAAEFELTPSTDARVKQLEIISYRTKTQPYGDKSAGCMFRNPETIPAGALIEKCGLKGLKVGGAEVSDIHANFIINSNESTSADVVMLITQIKERVKNQTGIELESEVRFVPY